MSIPSSAIQQLLKALHDQSAVVSEAMRGPIFAGGKREKGVDTLIRMRALVPMDEDTYYLNPLLREFIGGHLVSFGAFKQLARLDAPLRQLELEFNLLVDFRREGALHDADLAEGRLGDVVLQIKELLDGNLLLLGTKVRTNFGDVESVAGKLRENRFYFNEVRRFSRQIVILDKKVQHLEGEALAHHLPEVRRLLNVGLLSRLPEWSGRIRDIQTIVSRNLYALRQIEERQRNLSAIALWLSKNSMAEGFDLDVGPEAAAKLAMPSTVKCTWTIDVNDRDIAVTEGMLKAAQRLPPLAALSKPAPMEPPVVLATEQLVVKPEIDPVDELIESYLDFIRTNPSAQPELDHSLVRWREAHDKEAHLPSDITHEEWLLYACSQVAAAGLRVEMVARERRSGEFNDIFTDAYAQVHAPLRTGAASSLPQASTS